MTASHPNPARHEASVAQSGQRRPDFFIVGAPKCGTTALAHYLAEHPQIFLSEPKEPNYFARHLSVGRAGADPDTHHTSLERYLELFSGATAEHLAVGEASTRYLRSPQALRDIRSFQPGARIIVQLRNPVELAQSWHSQKLWEGQETEASFLEAWKLQQERREGRSLPRGLTASDALLYEHVASLGSQLESVLGLFPSERVLVIFLDDMRREPQETYEQALEFLGVPSDGRSEFPLLNVGKRSRWPWLAEIVRNRPAWSEPLIRGLRAAGLAGAFRKASAMRGEREALPPDFHRELLGVFAPEIDKLERITGRGLHDWLEPEPEVPRLR